MNAHFRIRRPVVGQLQRVFLDRWAFMNRQEVERFPADDSEAGPARCRIIVEGPDEDLDKLLSVLVAAVSSAREHVAIVTPYFVPPREVVGALKAAALRGVEFYDRDFAGTIDRHFEAGRRSQEITLYEIDSRPLPNPGPRRARLAADAISLRGAPSCRPGSD